MHHSAKLAPTGNVSVPIQLAQCRFYGLAVSNAKMLRYFQVKIYGSNFIKQHSETVTVRNYESADCRFKKKYCVNYSNFRHTLVSYSPPVIDAARIVR